MTYGCRYGAKMSWRERAGTLVWSSRPWLVCVRTYRRARLWLHNLIRDEGLVEMHTRVSSDRAKRDPELGAAHDEHGAPTQYGAACALTVAFAIACSVYLFIGLVYVLMNGEVPPELAAGIDEMGYAALLHVQHDPMEDAHVAHADPANGAPPEPRPYTNLHMRVVQSTGNVSAVVHEPCRRLSRAEILAGITTEGYVLPLILMRMCEIVHDIYGCDEAGILIPKHMVTPDNLNICVITYKEKSGVCRHYINPVVRPVLSTTQDSVSVSSPHFPSIGMHVMTMRPSVLLSYQPIVHAQAAHAENPSDQSATRALSDTYDSLKLPEDGQWLSELPQQQTITIGAPQSYFYFIAHSALLGEYPPAAFFVQ